jgi:hypothetical protein
MEIGPAALVTILNRMHKPVILNETTRHWFWDVYEIVPPNPYWAASAAAALVNQHLTQSRLAEVLGDDGATGKVAAANALAVDQFNEALLATPFEGVRLAPVFVVVIPVLPWPPPIPPHWNEMRYPEGVPGTDLLLAGAQFYQAAQHPDAKSESVTFADAATRLFEEGLVRIAAKSE